MADDDMMSIQSIKSRLDKLKSQVSRSSPHELTDDHGQGQTQNTTEVSQTQTGPTVLSAAETFDVANKIHIPVNLRDQVDSLEAQNASADQWLVTLKQLADVRMTDNNQRLIMLFHYYGKAFKSLSSSEEKVPSYGQLLVRYALLRGEFAASDGTRAFSSARNAARKFAFVHVAAAQFELDHGNRQKARQILVKAKAKGAEPQEEIRIALQNFFSDKPLASFDIENEENVPSVESTSSEVFINALSSPLKPESKRQRSSFDQVVSDSTGSLSEESPIGSSNKPVVLSKYRRAPLESLSLEQPNHQSDEEPSRPQSRSLRSCHSTPDCKLPSMLSSASKSSSSKSSSYLAKAARIPVHMQKLDEEEDLGQCRRPSEDKHLISEQPSAVKAERVAVRKSLEAKIAQPPLNKLSPPSPPLSASKAMLRAPPPMPTPNKTGDQLPSEPGLMPEIKDMLPFLKGMFTIKVNGKLYLALKQIGRGGSSKVYCCMSQDRHEFAIKCVDLNAAEELTTQGYINEINLLQRLQHSNHVIRMYDYEYNESKGALYIVMEKGVRDLTTELRMCLKQGLMIASTIKDNWRQMLLAVQVLHKEGIVHSDLKPANFVRSVGLKLIDFGIANAIQHDKTSVSREQQIGSLNYMSPEAIIDVGGAAMADMASESRAKPRFKIGVKSDVWSLGCILYFMVYNCTPFQKVSSVIKLHAIINPNFKIEFAPIDSPDLLDTMQRCLQRDPKQRPSIEELLQHPYLAS